MENDSLTDGHLHKNILKILILGLVLSLLGDALVFMIFGSSKWQNVPLHSVLEAMGFFSGLTLAYTLLQSSREGQNTAHHLPMACGFIAMATLDGFHAISSPGNTLVWLHSVAIFFSGLIFSTLWLFGRRPQHRWDRWLIGVTLFVSVLTGIVSLAWQTLVPPMIQAGSFTDLASGLNIIGGLGFLLAALWFMTRSDKTALTSDYIFAFSSLQFGLAGVLFASSAAWEALWWFWHVLRLFAYAVALSEVFRLYRLTQNEIKNLNLNLESRVAARTRELQSSQLRIQAILDNTIEGIITIDQLGTVIELNRAAENIFGYPSGEIIGNNIRMLMPQAYGKRHDEHLKQYAVTGLKKAIGNRRELQGQRKDGSTFPMEVAISELKVDGVQMFSGIVRDVTERNKIETIKTEFVSTVSHELRTPLTAIIGALGLLTGHLKDTLPSATLALVDLANKNSLRLAVLINDLLDMEKIAAGKMHFDLQNADLMTLVEQSLEITDTYSGERKVKLVLSKSAPQVVVLVDKQRLLQVMSNLLSNAIKYSPDFGSVDIAVEITGEQVQVSITDTGAGIPTAFRDRIFQKFSQSDSSDSRQKGGTGLGLALAREMVERMGGKIDFDSTEGQGSCFYFLLPLASKGTEVTT